jgi:hypothetical protein
LQVVWIVSIYGCHRCGDHGQRDHRQVRLRRRSFRGDFGQRQRLHQEAFAQGRQVSIFENTCLHSFPWRMREKHDKDPN